MPKINEIPKDTRIREGRTVATFFAIAQTKEKSLTQSSLAFEMDVTQGMINKWFTGRSPIAIHRLLYLAKRLEFDPSQVRPTLNQYTNLVLVSETEKLILELFRKDAGFCAYVTAMVNASPEFLSAEQAISTIE